MLNLLCVRKDTSVHLSGCFTAKSILLYCLIRFSLAKKHDHTKQVNIEVFLSQLGVNVILVLSYLGCAYTWFEKTSQLSLALAKT